MSTPANISTDRWASKTLRPNLFNGGDLGFYNSFTIAATAIAGTKIGMIRVEKGDKISLEMVTTDDLDTSTNVTFTVGIMYDSNTDYADDEDKFMTTQSGQAAAKLLRDAASMTADAYEFVVPTAGYITVSLTGGPTTTNGAIALAGVISSSDGIE